MSVATLGAINTVAEVAAFARVHQNTVRRAIRDGDLEALRAGTQLRIRAEAVWTWLSGTGEESGRE